MFVIARSVLEKEIEALFLACPDENNQDTVEMRASMLEAIDDLKLARNYLAGKRESQLKLDRILEEIQELKTSTKKELEQMNTAEQAAFDAVNKQLDVLSTAATSLVELETNEAQQLKDALAANDSDGIVAASTALSNRLNTIISTVSAALTPPAPPVVPVTPPAADPSSSTPAASS